MTTKSQGSGAIMRLFHVKAKKGCAAQLIDKFATTSVGVVQGEPGNVGCFYGKGVEVDEDIVVFASFWKDIASVKERFGQDWQVSFLPDGYEELIEECSVQHIDVGSGWHVQMEHA